MTALIEEIFGLFVDDGSLAIVILVIVAVAGSISVRFDNASAAVGAVLLIGSLATLIENVVRTARKERRRTL